MIRLKLTGPAGHMLVGAKTDKYESRAPLQKGELIEADPPDDYTIRYRGGWLAMACTVHYATPLNSTMPA